MVAIVCGVISNVHSLVTGVNSLREEQGSSEEITTISNSLENIAKNSVARRGFFLQEMDGVSC